MNDLQPGTASAWPGWFEAALSGYSQGIVAYIGLILTLLGLYFTFRQAKRARLAAEAANSAVAQSKRLLNIADAASCRHSIQMFKIIIQKGDPEISQIFFDRTLREIYYLLDVMKSLRHPETSFEIIHSHISYIQTQITSAQDRGFPQNKRKIITKLNELEVFFFRFEADRAQNLEDMI